MMMIEGTEPQRRPHHPGLFRSRKAGAAGISMPPVQSLVLQRRDARRHVVAAGHPGFLFPLLETLARLRDSDAGRGVFAFAGPDSGVGVSYVTRLVAQELAVENGCRVLIGDAQTFEKDAPIRGYLELVPGVWTYIDDDDLTGMADVVRDSIFTNLKPSDFGYVIIDCRPVNESGDALRMARKVDGLFLVVAAGQTKRSQIEHAQGVLQFGTDQLVGLVLNRRTYPVPKTVFKLL
jgi:Mrp family chromosome partitioning ATPase